MNVLLLTPGISRKFNDNYHAYHYMSKMGGSVLAISQRENINKGGKLEISPEFEADGNLSIFRVFDTLREQKSILGMFKQYSKIKEIILEFNPEVIFCEELSNMMLAKKIKQDFNIPIVLRVEFIYDEKYPYRTMGRKLRYFKNPLTKDFLPILIGKSIWNWAYKNSDAVISCYFEDASKDIARKDKPFAYVPWPAFQFDAAKDGNRLKNRAVFIGAFDHHKNLKELLSTIPLLIQNTPVKEFYIVGTGEDLHIVDSLKKKFPDNIKHIVSLSREECLNLIQSSCFSYSPATRGGWGFIGDSWAAGVPVVVTHNHYNFQDGVDSVVTTPDQIVDKVNELCSSHELFAKISSGGRRRFLENHTAESVGRRFLDICHTVVKSKRI